ncbi:helicase C-terminal domain-containing protein [Cladochytrium replicatum]|nr:helicase C-terminal domain-containing protein [Cladochytrium replicatum]
MFGRFSFPYEPYNVQNEFMETMHDVLVQGQVGILESPTGTGKSLSLICGSLTWIREQCTAEKKVPINLKGPSWLIAAAKRSLEEMAANELVSASNEPRHTKRRRIRSEPEQDDPLPDDYDSSEETSTEDGYFSELTPMHEPPRQIMYTSRTHSQLAQFVEELRKTEFGDSTKLVTLGSRKTLCINSKIKRGNLTAEELNERCRELLTTKEGCPNFDRTGAKFNQFREKVHSEVQDMEDLVKLGEQTCTCPYYGSRIAAKSSEVVLLPYSSLLSRQAREGLGINLKGKVVIIDEAHNIVSAIESVNSVSISTADVQTALVQLDGYYERFRSRLAGRNVVYIKQLQKLLQAIVSLSPASQSTVNDGIVYGINEFMRAAGCENVNFFKIESYLMESKLAFKLAHYGDQQTKIVGAQVPLQQIVMFFSSLMNCDGFGKVLATQNGFKFCLLESSWGLSDITDVVHSMILAGGTMSPVADLIQQLFPTVPASRIVTKSFGHIVPSTSVLAMCVTAGPQGESLDLKFENRDKPETIDAIGRLIRNLTALVPDGLICFFPSYGYLETFAGRCEQTGLLEQLGKRKKVFRERKGSAGVENVFDEYLKQINSGQGGILFAVMGGKLSEGINFKDRLARAVVVLGLPYVNPSDPELQEKMQYIKGKQRSGAITLSPPEYVNNMCLRVVNQSIGRAIRHINDFAAIYLVDTRWSNPNLREKLPNWIINSGIVVPKAFGEVLQSTVKFFKSQNASKLP